MLPVSWGGGKREAGEGALGSWEEKNGGVEERWETGVGSKQTVDVQKRKWELS